jgi:subfamily B ATP-binding cassette protein HlyB/CyaB
MTSQQETGLFALVSRLRPNGVAAEQEQPCHRLGAGRVGVTEMLRCAKGFGLKARTIKTNPARPARTPWLR